MTKSQLLKFLANVPDDHEIMAECPDSIVNSDNDPMMCSIRSVRIESTEDGDLEVTIRLA